MKIKRVLRSILLLLIIFLVLTIILGYSQQDITGFFLVGGEYIQEINLEAEGDGSYNWEPEVECVRWTEGAPLPILAAITG